MKIELIFMTIKYYLYIVLLLIGNERYFKELYCSNSKGIVNFIHISAIPVSRYLSPKIRCSGARLLAPFNSENIYMGSILSEEKESK